MKRFFRVLCPILLDAFTIAILAVGGLVSFTYAVLGTMTLPERFLFGCLADLAFLAAREHFKSTFSRSR